MNVKHWRAKVTDEYQEWENFKEQRVTELTHYEAFIGGYQVAEQRIKQLEERLAELSDRIVARDLLIDAQTERIKELEDALNKAHENERKKDRHIGELEEALKNIRAVVVDEEAYEEWEDLLNDIFRIARKALEE